MSLHYLVKLEMLIGHVLPLSSQRKKLQKLSHLNCGLQIHQIWMQLITARGDYTREDVQNTHHWSVIWTNWNSDWEQGGSSWAISSLRQPFVSGVIDSSRSVMRLLYTFSCNISHQLNSHRANLEATVEMG